MVRCEECELLEIIGGPDDELQNRCQLLNLSNLDVLEERDCIDFQPGP